jgi:hypothetical protein
MKSYSNTAASSTSYKMALSSNEDLLVTPGKICSVRIAWQLLHYIQEVLFYQIDENYVDESPWMFIVARTVANNDK